MPGKGYKKKGGNVKPRMARKGRKGGRRRVRDVPDLASLSVKRTLTPVGGGNFVSNQMYDMRNTDLASYARAVQVAQAYQHYRIKKISLTIKLAYDTYQQANALPGGGSRPNLYYMIDKSGSIPNNITLEALKQMGAKPFQADEKPFVISWRPSVLTGDAQAPGVLASAQYKISPWLSTSANPLANPWAASTIDHLGVYWYMDQVFGGGVQYTAEVEVQFQFKKPLAIVTAGSQLSQSVAVAVLDDSPDGIVGGGDTNPSFA